MDEIAWLFNLRGRDIDYNPVFFAFAVISIDSSADLFIDQAKLSPDVTAYLHDLDVTLHPYNSIIECLRSKSQMVGFFSSFFANFQIDQ